jgi:hypothetical protein
MRHSQFTTEDRTVLLQYWQAFHMREISIMPVTLPQVLNLKIMKEKFTNNKSEYRYENFGYFTLVNSDTE